MTSIAAQRALARRLRAHAPREYAAANEELRSHYGRKLLGIRDIYERRLIGRDYAEQRVRMLTSLVRAFNLH